VWEHSLMNSFLLSCCLLALVLFAFMRPRWRHIGPSLLDSFVIGLCLFALGSVLVWIEGLPDSEAVMRMGTLAALSGILGASLCSYLFAPRIAELGFLEEAKRFCADPYDRFIISAGLVISTLASLILLSAVFSHPHIRSLLLDALFHEAGTLNEARVIISSGVEGYFAPGYVKQFRDVIVPIFCVAAILCDGTYRHRVLFYAALLIALATTFLSGQRLVIVHYIFCLGAAFLIGHLSPRPRFAPIAVIVVLLLTLVGAVGLMTKMLGRLDVALSPLAEKQKQVMLQTQLSAQEKIADLLRNQIKIAEEKLKRASGSEAMSVQSELEKASAMAIRQRQIVTQLRQGQISLELSGPLTSLSIPPSIAPVVALAHRAVIAVPRENTTSFSLWSGNAPALGAGWLTDLSGVLPGTQNQLSNELAAANNLKQNSRSTLGNSPLGLATDVYYNWGWLGLVIVPVLYSLAFGALDIGLTGSNSPLTSASKIFMFFAIPLMYSPFLFILYGGFVVMGILCYVWLLRKGAFSFLGGRTY
jgi:hypothetical protein